MPTSPYSAPEKKEKEIAHRIV